MPALPVAQLGLGGRLIAGALDGAVVLGAEALPEPLRAPPADHARHHCDDDGDHDDCNDDPQPGGHLSLLEFRKCYPGVRHANIYRHAAMTPDAIAAARPAARPKLDPAAGLVVLSAVSSQFAAVIAFHVFDRIGPVGAAGGRVGFAALFLVLATGLPRGHSRAEWRPVVPLGITLAVMNTTFYLALDRLPLGVAVTVEFLGPIAIAVVASRSARHLAAAALAALGIALLGQGLGGSSTVGLLFAGIAGTAWAIYILAARHVAPAGRARAG